MIKSYRQDVFDYVSEKYGSEIEFLWRRTPNYAIFRNADNNKWYGAILDVKREKLGLDGEEKVDIVNVKVDDPMFRDSLLEQVGFFPGYHSSKGYWISILLDGTVPLEEIKNFIDESYDITAAKKKKENVRRPKDWIIPANPKYYDIEHAFDDTDEIEWKQGAGIRVGDTVYMYVAAPVSAILYECKVVDTDIPYEYEDKNLTIKALMKIRLTNRYDPSRFTFDMLKSDYGIYAVRRPRGVPHSLKEDLRFYMIGRRR